MDNQNQTVSTAPPSENIPVQNPVAKTPPPAPKSFFSTRIILLIVILLILLGTGGAYLALKTKNAQYKPVPKPIVKITPSTTPTPTPDPTAGWKTYTGSDFTFKYPPDWVQTTTTIYPGTYPPFSEIIQASPNLEIANNKTAEYMDFLQVRPEISLSEIKNFLATKYITSQLKVENRLIDNTNIEVYTGCLNPEACEILTGFILPMKNGSYTILDLRIQDKETLNQILSTFKFLN